MTAWTPSISVTNNGTTYTGYVDWNMSISAQQYDVWDVPSPSTASLSLHYTNIASINPFNVGDLIQISINYSIGSGPFYTGKVADSELSYTSYGAQGSILTCRVSLIGALQPLTAMTGVVRQFSPAAALNTSDMITYLMQDISSTRWNELDATITWNDLQPAWTWAVFDTLTAQLYNGYTLTLTGDPDIWDAGSLGEIVPTWDVLKRYLIQSSATMYEDKTGKIIMETGAAKPTPASVASGLLDPYSLVATTGIVNVRNKVHITAQDNLYEYYYSDATSVVEYGAQLTNLSDITLLGNPDNLGNRIVDGLAFPRPGITGFGIELLNNAMTDAERDALLNVHIWSGITLTGLDPIWGYNNELAVLGYSWNISKNSFYLTTSTIPAVSFYGGNTWQQISPAYTWTSYGTAFPTQKWSDL